MLMPIYFYCVTRSKYPMFFYLGGFICYGFILLSLSRTSILFATSLLALCILFLCIYNHKNRLKIKIYSLIFLIGAICILVYYHESFLTIFNEILRVGFSDSGRLELYKYGLTKFLDHPILGAGFGNSFGINDKFIINAPKYYHNTIVQIFASCGIIGFIAYAYHRYQTVKLFLKTRDSYSFFTGMSILALLLTSLLDIHIFNIFPTIIYSTTLCIFEKSTINKENV